MAIRKWWYFHYYGVMEISDIFTGFLVGVITGLMISAIVVFILRRFFSPQYGQLFEIIISEWHTKSKRVWH